MYKKQVITPRPHINKTIVYHSHHDKSARAQATSKLSVSVQPGVDIRGYGSVITEVRDEREQLQQQEKQQMTTSEPAAAVNEATSHSTVTYENTTNAVIHHNTSTVNVITKQSQSSPSTYYTLGTTMLILEYLTI